LVILAVSFKSIIFVLGALGVLQRQVVDTRYLSLASSSRANLVTQLRAYLLFCHYFLLVSVPVVEDNLMLFIQFLGNNLKSPDSVKNYVYGIQTVSTLKGWSFPDLSSKFFKLQFKGLSKLMKHTPKRALPVSPPILQKMARFVDFKDPLEVSLWGVTVLGFMLFARLSNLLPKGSHRHHLKNQLSRNHVRVASDCVIVTISWTKTLQDGSRVLNIPLKTIPGSILCPKGCLLKICQISKGSGHDHLFAYATDSGLQIPSRYQFTQFLRSKLKKCGFQSKLFSGHSLRRGGATWAFRKGVSTELIKSHGDWASDAYFAYLEFSLWDKLSTTTKMVS